jgi:hypothetical protein
MKTTLKMLCARTNIARTELTVEAQRLYDLYEDPAVSPEKKEQVKKQLDAIIKKLEERATTRRTKSGQREMDEPRRQTV